MSWQERVTRDTALAPFTWFRVGGPADRLFLPTSETELAAFLQELPADEPLRTIGVGSNLLVREGGIRGSVIRLGPAFGKISADGTCLTAGAAALDAQVAKQAAAAGIAGLEFFRGIPGTIGGAVRMNAGAYGTETKDRLVSARVMNRRGDVREIPVHDLGFRYRHSAITTDDIVLSATFEGTPDEPAAIEARMEEIMTARERTQPVKSRTGGSTFKNPDPQESGGRSAWQLIDGVGGRGRIVGGAQMSELHCNFMLNLGDATADDLERLGEGIRADVRAKFGVDLNWEIRRIGEH